MSDPTPFNYGPIRTVGIRLIKQFGRSCKLLRTTEAAPADPSKPWRVGPAAAPAETAFRGVVVSIAFPARADPLVDQTDIDIFAPGDLGTEPLMTDRVQVLGSFAGQTDPIYGVLGVRPINPDGSAIVYQIRCRAWPLLAASSASM